MEISFEFFPPKNEIGLKNLMDTATQLATLNPQFFSVTFGAGGSTREHTPNTVKLVKEATRINTAPHISCVCSTKPELIELIKHYQSAGINSLVVLRGDKPSGFGGYGEFRHAHQLVELIRHETHDYFNISVAAYPETHPESKNMRDELEHFKEKVECGANQAITQYFYNPDAYFHFVDACLDRGIDIPIIPGVMPITNYEKIARFSQMCGAEIPAWIRKQCEAYGDDLESIKQFGFEMTLNLCQTLLEGGAPGLHFYTLNQIEPSLGIYQELKNY